AGVRVERLANRVYGDGAGRPFRRGLDGLHDVLVAGAAAQIALEPDTNLLISGPRCTLQKIDRGYHRAGRTESALEPVLLVKRVLKRVHAAVAGHPFDRRHLA